MKLSHIAGKVPNKYLPLFGTFLVMIALGVFGSLSYKNFYSAENFVKLFNDNAPLGMAAIGGTFVILSGGIDLSVGAMMACGSIAIAWLINNPATGDFKADPNLVNHAAKMDPVLVWLIVLAAGTLIGGFMGLMIELSRLPPFLVTLSFMFIARGLAFRFYYKQLSITHAWYVNMRDHRIILSGDYGIGNFHLFTIARGVQVEMFTVCFLAALVIAMIVLHMTKFGRSVYALGDDEHSAALLGLPVARSKVGVYAIAGFCSAAAAILQTFKSKAGDPSGQPGWELRVIASVVIGGTLLSGGSGFVIGTLFGVLILGLIDQLVNFSNISNASISPIVIGVLLLLFILLQKAVDALSRRAAKMAAMQAAQKAD